MNRFVVFAIGFVVTILILKCRWKIKEFTGEIAFAEAYLGVGGTNRFIILMAFLVFVGSLMYALGTIQGILKGTVGRFFGV
ncbi:hypothetical protein JKY72_01360 [Candidatus Gracilibacteria bacterium]|nr:hypothetical protein [Candidatus Gracilibacteria bacterium]